MDTLNTYEELKKENAFNDKQAKTLTKVLSSLVTKKYFEERLNILRKEFKNEISDLRKDFSEDVNNLRKDVQKDVQKDIQIAFGKFQSNMYLTAISMTGIIIAAMKFM